MGPRALLHALHHYVLQAKIILVDFNLAFSTPTAKPPNLIPCQIFWLYGIVNTLFGPECLFVCLCTIKTGADPEIEEVGGGAHIDWGFGAAMRHTHTARSLVCAYNGQHSRGVWGYAPPGNFKNLDHMRVLLRTVIQVIYRMVWSFLGAPPFGISLCI